MDGVIKKIRLSVVLILIATAVLCVGCDTFYFSEIYDYYLLRIHFIDVGQGDSIFIELPDSTTMLIDAGEKHSGDTVAEYVLSQGYNKIDYLVATHPHTDHIGGMAKIIENFEIGKIYMPDVDTDTRTYENLLETIADNNLKIKTARAGNYIIDSTDFKAKILAPVTIDEDNLNNCSIVIRLEYDDTSFLFTGDAELESFEAISGEIYADVLKVGHHGSVTSTDEELLSKINPYVAVISCGENNDYGHPHKEVMEYLEACEADIYRTDEDGTVTVFSDGKNIVVETETERGSFFE